MRDSHSDPSHAPPRERSAAAAAAWGAPIGCAGGLIGLGGAEFRLPVLVQVFRRSAKQAVPLNLSVSLVTVLAALVTRLALGGRESLLALEAIVVVVVALAAGGVAGAQIGALWSRGISERALRRTILVLLVGIGTLLFAEAFTDWSPTTLASTTSATVALGVGFGLAIGVVSSLLGVAGGELLIPTLILAFGVDIKLAGTASLIISLPTMIVGLRRHWRNAAFATRADLRQLVLPMGIGSVVGAVVGGALVAHVPATALELLLGAILIVSAVKIFRD